MIRTTIAKECSKPKSSEVKANKNEIRKRIKYSVSKFLYTDTVVEHLICATIVLIYASSTWLFGIIGYMLYGCPRSVNGSDSCKSINCVHCTENGKRKRKKNTSKEKRNKTHSNNLKQTAKTQSKIKYGNVNAIK